MLIQNRKILKTQVKELNIIFKKKITEQNDLFFRINIKNRKAPSPPQSGTPPRRGIVE
jgi:hypothetical protein